MLFQEGTQLDGGMLLEWDLGVDFSARREFNHRPTEGTEDCRQWRGSGALLGPMLVLGMLMDFFVKTGVCFNFSWLLAAVGAWVWWRARRPNPPLLLGWALGAVLYIAAGYYVNKIHLIGYPLRMSYAVFPIIFFWLAAFFETRVAPEKRPVRAVQFCLFQFAVNLTGVFLDPGHMGVKATDVLQSVRDFFMP